MRILGNPNLAIDVQGYACKRFCFAVTTLLYQDAGPPHDVSRSNWIVFSKILQPGPQCPTRVGFSLCQPALLGLHSGLAENHEINAFQDLAFCWRILLRQDILQRSNATKLSLPIRGFGFAEPTACLKNLGTMKLQVSLP